MYDSEFEAAAAKWGVPRWLLEAVAWTESSMKATAFRFEPKLNQGSYGLMQILESTARGLGYTGPLEGLYNPAVNIDLGAKLLAGIWKRSANLADLYSEYNSGSSGRWRTSAQVSAHVGNFLRNVAKVTGVTIPANASITDSLKLLAGTAVDYSGLLVILGLMMLAARKGAK